MPAIRVDYAVRETVTNMKRNVFMAVAAVLVVAVSLFLVGGVLLLRSALNRAVTLQTRKVEVGVFLSKEVTPDQRTSIQQDLVAMPEVANVIYESKPEAYQHFLVLFADAPDITQNVKPDDLPESFRVKLRDPHKFEVVHDRLVGRPGIGEIKDQRAFLNKVLHVVGDIQTIGFFMVLTLAIAAGVLIATTIRMAIYARRKEIAIMKLVGATNWFIRVPFMMEGIVQGVVGALVAVLLLLASRPFIVRLAKSFAFLGVTVSVGEILTQTFLLVGIGIVIGALGSLLGLRRFLEV
jgi:cell division transport system permease protein